MKNSVSFTLPPRLSRLAAPAMALILCGGATICGCHNFGSTNSGAKSIAIITPAGSNEFNSELAEGAADEAKLLGWNKCKHFAPPGDADDAELVDLALKALSEKPDAISVCGMQSSALERVIKSANSDGIPVFIHNQITPVSGDVAAYIGYDEFDAGRTCGNYALKLLSQGDKTHIPVGQVAILDGAPGDHTNQRAGGFREALKYIAGVQIVEEKSGDWDKDKADKLVTEWVKRYPKLNLIFACNDNMAIGASHALFTADLNGDGRSIRILGFGGTHDALVKVKYGDIDSTLALDPRKMGARIVHEMMDSFAGTETYRPGEVIHTDTKLVSSQNLDDFMGGFDHTPPPPEPQGSAGSGADAH